MEDVRLSVHVNHDNNYYHTYTSIASISDRSGRSFKAYGWSETASFIKFAYNLRHIGAPAQFVTLPRPKFNVYAEQRLTRKGRTRMKKIRKYIYEFDIESEFNIVGYVPACLRIHYGNYNSFRFVCAKLCYQKCGNRADDIIIIDSFSS